MATTKEIKTRIKSVRDTQKITNAMYLIASTKMRKAKVELDETRPYFIALKNEIKRIFKIHGDADSAYFFPPEGQPLQSEAYALLVITADKGLAGAYNQNVIKKAEELLKESPESKLFVVGEYGRHYFKQRNIPIEKSFLYTAQNPSIRRAREICHQLLELYDNKEVGKVFIIYTDLKAGTDGDVMLTRFLPFHKGQFLEKDSFHSQTEEKEEDFDFVPSVDAVINSVVPAYVTGFIYSALVDSFCSEQQARMNAMSNANDNAEEILADLSIQYNRLRQAAITQEITEVAAGAKAQKRRHNK